jgi:hypothetical protein
MPSEISSSLAALRDRFTYGQCHGMAFALHEATGWPIGCLMAEWRHSPRSEDIHTSVVHAYVRAPDGGIMDARGLTDTGSLQSTFFGRGGRHIVRSWEETFDEAPAFRGRLLRCFALGQAVEIHLSEFDELIDGMIDRARSAMKELDLASDAAILFPDRARHQASLR